MAITSCFLLGVTIAVAALSETHGHPGTTHFEPQVAILCDPKEKFINKRIDETGKWVTDWEHKATCIEDKVDILEYCRKVYPDKDIQNIVETEYQKIENWCPLKSLKCRKSAKVKPVRCLSGEFQSDALLVPHGCQFDHVHNASQCLVPDAWKVVAEKSCTQRELELRSHAMLRPCGVDVFQGVEFVCCPHDAGLKEFNSPNELDTDEDDDEDDLDDDEDEDADDDEDDEDDEDEPETSSAPTSSTADPRAAQTPDPYLLKFDPENERSDFLAAKDRIEKHHESRVSEVMKDWGLMEEKYQDMKIADAQKAEVYRREMTAKFQKRVDILEADGDAEKQQIVAMHQQRILRTINNRKRDALTCYREALNQRVPSIHKVEKCLQKLLRALHKDRHHTLAHYQHLLNMNFDEAERQREVTLERLMDLDRTVNQSLDLLNRFPELQQKLRPLMDQFADALRTKQNFADSAIDGTTFAPNSKLLARTMDAEKETMDVLRDRALVKKKVIDERKRGEEEMRKTKWLNRMKKKQEMEKTKQKLAEPTTTESSTTKMTAKPVGTTEQPSVVKEQEAKIVLKKFDPVALDDDHSLKDSPVPSNHFEDEDEKAHLQHVPEEIPVAHAQAHELSHSQSSFSVVARDTGSGAGSKAGYVTVAFAGLALMTVLVITIVVLRRRSVASPQNQGFVEVDQSASPEERHIANMQINGYENPTYKYFEETDT